MWIGTLVFAVCAGAENTTAYLFSYFTGNGEDGLHLATSDDGYRWEALNQGKPLLAPRVGKHKLMRDPCLIQTPDGTFHLVWTTSWEDNGIGYAHSKNLKDWSEQQFFPVMAYEPTVRNTWAPEIFHDAARTRFLLFWSSTIPGRFPETEDAGDAGHNHRMYFTVTTDLKNFTAPGAKDGASSALFFNDGFNVIDGTVVKDGNVYILFLKDETLKPPKKNIRMATATNPEGPWSAASPPITGSYWAEGPTAIRINGKMHVYFDKYMEGKYGVVVSQDLKTWSEESDKLRMPEGMRHGSVLEVAPEIIAAIQN
ncbi:MAG: hypothetical protein AMXMBFR84_01700 [Candidatus Hydrogenedentota bacterium]